MAIYLILPGKVIYCNPLNHSLIQGFHSFDPNTVCLDCIFIIFYLWKVILGGKYGNVNFGIISKFCLGNLIRQVSPYSVVTISLMHE